MVNIIDYLVDDPRSLAAESYTVAKKNWPKKRTTLSLIADIRKMLPSKCCCQFLWLADFWHISGASCYDLERQRRSGKVREVFWWSGKNGVYLPSCVVRAFQPISLIVAYSSKFAPLLVNFFIVLKRNKNNKIGNVHIITGIQWMYTTKCWWKLKGVGVWEDELTESYIIVVVASVWDESRK